MDLMCVVLHRLGRLCRGSCLERIWWNLVCTCFTYWVVLEAQVIVSVVVLVGEFGEFATQTGQRKGGRLLHGHKYVRLVHGHKSVRLVHKHKSLRLLHGRKYVRLLHGHKSVRLMHGRKSARLFMDIIL